MQMILWYFREWLATRRMARSDRIRHRRHTSTSSSPPRITVSSARSGTHQISSQGHSGVTILDLDALMSNPRKAVPVIEIVILLIIAVVVYMQFGPQIAGLLGDTPIPGLVEDLTREIQVVTDPNGRVTSCEQDGQIITFTSDGRPSFIDPDGKMNETIPKIGPKSSWYCFQPDEWSEFLTKPGVMDALITNILNHSKIKKDDPTWRKAVQTALETSIGKNLLILPGQTRATPVPTSVVIQPTVPQGKTPTPFQPEENTPTPTLSVAAQQKLQYDQAISEVLPGVTIPGDQDALYVLSFTWGEMLALSGQASVMPRLSPDGAFYNSACLWSKATNVEGKRVFKACFNIETQIAGGTWVSPYEVRFYPMLGGSGNNWGKDGCGFEAQVQNVYLYCVQVPTPIPFIPPPTVTPDLRPLETAVATFIPTPLPTPTPIPVSAIPYVTFITQIPANNNGIKLATCSRYQWPDTNGNYIASCEYNMQWVFVDWSINQYGSTAIPWTSWSFGSGGSIYPSSCIQQLGPGPWYACPK